MSVPTRGEHGTAQGEPLNNAARNILQAAADNGGTYALEAPSGAATTLAYRGLAKLTYERTRGTGETWVFVHLTREGFEAAKEGGR